MNDKKSKLDNILLLKTDEGTIKYKQELDPKSPCLDSGICSLIIGVPRCGKSLLILNMFTRFWKYYYENIFIISPSRDPTFNALYEYYGKPSANCSDSVIDNIIKFQYSMDQDEKTSFPRTNACIIVDDCLAIPSFNSRKMNSFSRLASNYRHVLRGHLPYAKEGQTIKQHGGGGAIFLSTQRYSSTIPQSYKSCCNVIIIGKLANRTEYENIINDYGGRVGGPENLRNMLNFCIETPYSFCCLYLDGDNDPETKGQTKVYKNMSELLYPTPRFPGENTKL